MKDIIKYNFEENTDLFGYRGIEWMWRGSAASLFSRIFRTIPSVRRHNYLTERDAMAELAEIYGGNKCFDLFECTYLPHLHNENDSDYDEDEGYDEVYNCVMILDENLMIGYFEKTVDIYYSARRDKSEVERIMDVCDKYRVKNTSLDNLFLVTYEHGYFDLKKWKINETAIDLRTHYNDDFLPVAETIGKFLLEDTQSSGLVILHGLQGTGKTTYIRHLINQGKQKMIYMSGDLIDKLSDPSFISFVRRQRSSVFIVEDCEELLSSRKSGNRMNAGLANILNISDGLMSDELCIKFICTFNAPLKDIDSALLRKGRLIARYEFRPLATDKVNRIIENESLDIPPQTVPMTLAEIYNYGSEDYSQKTGNMGFNG